MARVQDAEVKEIVTTKLEDVTAFITSANLLVTDLLGDSGLSDERLKEIERWLSAHLVSMNDSGVRAVEEEVGRSRRRVGEATRQILGEGLKLTRYGQQAMILDTTGRLTSLGKSEARFTVV
ncbi:MAG: hypothetical protein ACXABY_22585 [Candidatus Thorarchaeota archaeon]|jgi:hypothetical protein